MKDKKKILEEVEKTMLSYDFDEELNANPFLLTRINSQLNNRIQKKKNSLVVKLNLNTVLFMIIIIINLLTLAYNLDLNGKDNIKEKLVIQLKWELQIDETENNF